MGEVIVNTKVDEVYWSIVRRRNGLILALTEDVDDVYDQCRPDTEKGVCLYGTPKGKWRVNEPLDLMEGFPQPTVGINFIRDFKPKKSWISCVAKFSEAWLLSMATYLSRELCKSDREFVMQLFSDLGSLDEEIEQTRKRLATKAESGLAGSELKNLEADPVADVKQDKVSVSTQRTGMMEKSESGLAVRGRATKSRAGSELKNLEADPVADVKQDKVSVSTQRTGMMEKSESGLAVRGRATKSRAGSELKNLEADPVADVKQDKVSVSTQRTGMMEKSESGLAVRGRATKSRAGSELKNLEADPVADVKQDKVSVSTQRTGMMEKSESGLAVRGRATKSRAVSELKNLEADPVADVKQDKVSVSTQRTGMMEKSESGLAVRGGATKSRAVSEKQKIKKSIKEGEDKICDGCSGVIDDGEEIRCKLCNEWYHYHCVCMTKQEEALWPEFHCPRC